MSSVLKLDMPSIQEIPVQEASQDNWDKTYRLKTWYWLSTRQATMTGGTYLTVNGVAEVTGTSTFSGGLDSFGCSGTEASAIDV